MIPMLALELPAPPQLVTVCGMTSRGGATPIQAKLVALLALVEC